MGITVLLLFVGAIVVLLVVITIMGFVISGKNNEINNLNRDLDDCLEQCPDPETIIQNTPRVRRCRGCNNNQS